MQIRHAGARGKVNIGWLQSQHSFSFGHYYDANHMGHGPLRVINQDTVQPGGGFAEHGHANMEIISYVLRGGLAHKDSEGNESVIRPGDVQKMTAGTGIRHSEFNHSNSDTVEFLQIWVVPNKKNVAPGYLQQHIPALAEAASELTLIFSAEGRGASLPLYQDADVYAGRLLDNTIWQHELPSSRIGWLQVIEGTALVNGETVGAEDGVAFAPGEQVELSETAGFHALFFDMTAQ